MKSGPVYLIIAFILFLGLSGYAQDDATNDKSAGEKTVITDRDNENVPDVEKTPGKNEAVKNRKKRMVFQQGMIVVRERSIANIEAATTSTEISADDINARGEKLLSDTIQMVPGMQLTQMKKGNKEFNMRGYSMDKVALLVDGIPITDSYGNNMDIDNIMVMNVSKIVINRGVASSLYGTRGVVGTVNIVTQKPEAMFGDVRVEAGSYGNYMFNVAQGDKMGPFYYWLTTSVDISNGYRASEKLTKDKRKEWLLTLSRYDLYGYDLDDLAATYRAIDYYLTYEGRYPHTEHLRYQVSGKMGYEILKNLEAGVTASYINSTKKNSAFGTQMTSKYVTNLDQWSPPLASDVLYNMSSHWPEFYNVSASPYVDYSGDAFSMKGNFFFNQQSNTLEAFTDPDEFARSWSQTDLNATWSMWTSQSIGFNLFPSYKFSDWNKLNTAFSFRRENHTQEEKAQRTAVDIYTYYGRQPYKTQYIEAYYITLAVEDEIKPLDDLALTVGCSYDAQKLTKFQKKVDTLGSTKMYDPYKVADESMIWGTRDAFSPVIGAVYGPLFDVLKLRTAASWKHRFPSMEAYSKILKGSYDAVIEPEQSYNLNTGFQIDWIEWGITFSSDYFYSRYMDKIESVYDTAISDKRYLNIDGVAIHGAEMIITGTYEDIYGIMDITFSTGYTYLYTENVSDTRDTLIYKGPRMENTPAHQIQLDLRFRFITETSLNIFGYVTIDQIRYVMQSVPGLTSPYSTDYFIAKNLHNPVMLSIKISQQLFKRYELYVMCKNILDDYNADPFNPGPGRMFYFGADAKL